MGKRAKSARALKRKLAKRALKAQRRALYESFKGTGANKKSKRFRLGNRRKKNTLKIRALELVPVLILGETVLTLRAVHASSNRCGNVGCKKVSCRS